jgi:hypothetical protein
MGARRTESCRGESAEIEGWRRHQLLGAGFDADLAAELAGSRATDLHALLRLVDQGCRPELAARILAPLDPSAVEERPA